MSIKAMSRVWAESKQKGSALLLLLAIADHAKDDGSGAWPTVSTLADKTRMTERNVQKLLRKLEDDGELVTHHGAGPNKGHGPTNLYDIVFDGVNSETGVNAGTPQGVNAETPQGVNASSPKPLLNRHLNRHSSSSNLLTPDFGEAMQLYKKNINISESPITYQEMSTDRYALLPLDWWREAIEIAAGRNKRSWSYIRGIFEKCIKAGVSPKNYEWDSKNDNPKRSNNLKKKFRTGADLAKEPTFDPYTGEEVPPVS